jgi:hypothetical protein
MKPWHTHLFRAWNAFWGDPRYTPQPYLPGPPVHTSFAPNDYRRNTHNKSVLRHLGELGQPGPARVTYATDQASRSITPLLTRRSPRTCVFTVAVGSEYRKQVAPCVESHRAYAELHGYSFAELGTMPACLLRPLPWYKIATALHLLRQDFDTLLYIDADCLVTNPRIPLEELAQDWKPGHGSAPLCLAEDEGGINTGVFLLRNTPDAFRLLDCIWIYNSEIHHPNWEQEALKQLLYDHDEFARLLHIVSDPRSLNSFPHERLDFVKSVFRQNNTWRKGDFICHFSGLRHPYLEKIVEHYIKDLTP